MFIARAHQGCCVHHYYPIFLFWTTIPYQVNISAERQARVYISENAEQRLKTFSFLFRILGAKPPSYYQSQDTLSYLQRQDVGQTATKTCHLVIYLLQNLRAKSNPSTSNQTEPTTLHQAKKL